MTTLTDEKSKVMHICINLCSRVKTVSIDCIFHRYQKVLTTFFARSRKRYSSEGDVHDMATVGSDRTRLGSTGLCSTGLDSLPEIEDLRVEED